MTPLEFVQQFYPHADKVEKETGLPALFVVAQSALETGWGKSVAGNNMFGVKGTGRNPEREQLVLTTEFLSTPNQKFPEILSIEERIPGKRWKYTVRDWFRKYDSPADSFADHAVVLKADRYKPAWQFAMNSANPSPVDFGRAVARAGYATAPNYEEQIVAMIDSVKRRLTKDGKPRAINPPAAKTELESFKIRFSDKDADE